MLVILSPSKDMAVNSRQSLEIKSVSIPQYLNKAETLIHQLKKMSFEEIADRMAISKKLAGLNFNRFHQWNKNHTLENSSPSIIFYTGEAYRGLKAADFSLEELHYSQNVLRILSGLYGILRPLDLIQAYRLEMGLGLPFKGIKNFRDFWCDVITSSLNKAIEESAGEKVLINLASAEYYSAINFSGLKFPVISPVFKEEKSGKLKMVTVYTKRARGMMTRFIIQNRIEKSEDLKAFSDEGYYFENRLSSCNNWLFVR
jgi:uncharacterized protein